MICGCWQSRRKAKALPESLYPLRVERCFSAGVKRAFFVQASMSRRSLHADLKLRSTRIRRPSRLANHQRHHSREAQ